MTTPFQQNTQGITRFHLTLTGVEAGLPLCGCDKAAEPRTTQFFHAVYAPNAVFTDERLCKACKAAWDAAE